MKRLLISIYLISSIGLASAQVPAANFLKEDYPNEWAFTVEEVGIWCLEGKQLYVVEHESGNWYALNGIAKAKAKENMMEEDITPIWLDNPNNPGAKKSLGFWIDQGLSLCK